MIDINLIDKHMMKQFDYVKNLIKKYKNLKKRLVEAEIDSDEMIAGFVNMQLELIKDDIYIGLIERHVEIQSATNILNNL